MAAEDARFNRATKGVYTGSIMIFNIAMAIDSGKFKTTDMTDVTPAGCRSLHQRLPSGRLPTGEVMVVSSNKGSGRIADSLGAVTQRHYLMRWHAGEN